MTQFLESFEVFDLALGKPPLHCLPCNASVGDAIAMARELGVAEISVWDANLANCLGVVNNLDVLCFLAADHTLLCDLEAALARPIAGLVHRSWIQRVDLHERLSKALELVIKGVQYLIVPLPKRSRSTRAMEFERNSSSGSSRWPRKEVCWISQEAVMRFLMSCIAAFCPLPLFTIEELGIINRSFASIQHEDPAIEAIQIIHQASQAMSAVAIVVPATPSPSPSSASSTTENQRKLKLVGDISSSTLRRHDENFAAVAAALATLSAADFLSYVRGSNKRSSKILGKLIETRLAQKVAAAAAAAVADEDQVAGKPPTPLDSCEESSDSEQDSHRSGGLTSSFQNSGSRGCLTCRPWSSLAAVMAQALSHQCGYIWVTESESENTVVGIVTYVDMIRVLVKKLEKVGRLGSSQKLFSSTPKLVTRPDQSSQQPPLVLPADHLKSKHS
ncbi:hypothetical protein SELMODRAFT_443590 [Selaginella moellendorffii]|uniref:CBS domain-containing protein n=1 Tax=Selaginella moellendorffii TaxID=88036 RepID=D8S2G3_SELML|nr:CBS domain-containing protein CBSX5 [Selaginella moellendorffii]EFJ21458.1 hypothetical protein SELMODRAFT_443590 [Selaginella moellendorffii]|eukprot:XP_002977454.1 CBS domain-containing protein CBSX5 [Selaginella moellendorffii]